MYPAVVACSSPHGRGQDHRADYSACIHPDFSGQLEKDFQPSDYANCAGWCGRSSVRREENFSFLYFSAKSAMQILHALVTLYKDFVGWHAFAPFVNHALVN